MAIEVALPDGRAVGPLDRWTAPRVQVFERLGVLDFTCFPEKDT